MSNLREVRIAEYEAALNIAMDDYFRARPYFERTRDKERMFEGGFRMAWELLMPTNNE